MLFRTEREKCSKFLSIYCTLIIGLLVEKPAGVGRGKAAKDMASVLQERLSVTDDGNLGMLSSLSPIISLAYVRWPHIWALT